MSDKEARHQILPHWARCSVLYQFRHQKQKEEEKKTEEEEEERLNCLLITFRALMSDLDLDTWMGWCEVGTVTAR